MDFNGLKVQIAVLMQLQMALYDPSRGISVLSSKTNINFLKKNPLYVMHVCLHAFRNHVGKVTHG